MGFLNKKDKKSLIESAYYQVTLLSKPVIFVVIMILVVTLIYGPTITFAGEEITGFPQGGVLEQQSTTPTPTPTPSPTLRAPMQGGVLAPPPTLMESPSAGNLCELFPIHPSCKTPTPTPPPFDPTAPMQGGVLKQLQNDQPPLFGRNVPLQGFGVFGQQPAAIVPPSPVLTPVPPILTPEPPVPMFGSTQQQAAPTLPPTGDEGLTGVAPSAGQAAPLTDRGPTSCPIGNVWDPNLLMCVQRCPIGNVWDPNLMICVPDLPPLPTPRLCPDGSLPQSTGPFGIRPECPPSETEQPEAATPTGPILTPFPFPVSPTLPIPPQDDGSEPLNPQGGGILQQPKAPEAEQPEVEEEPQDEGQEEPDEGQDTATGPLT